MVTNIDAWNIAGTLRRRSRCRFKVGAVLTDAKGRVFAWGWNHAGPNGRGLCAERHALQRANPGRLAGATIHIRAFNGVNESPSMPCWRCHAALTRAGVAKIEYTDPLMRARTTSTPAATAQLSRTYILRHRRADDDPLKTERLAA